MTALHDFHTLVNQNMFIQYMSSCSLRPTLPSGTGLHTKVCVCEVYHYMHTALPTDKVPVSYDDAKLTIA